MSKNYRVMKKCEKGIPYRMLGCPCSFFPAQPLPRKLHFPPYSEIAIPYHLGYHFQGTNNTNNCICSQHSHWSTAHEIFDIVFFKAMLTHLSWPICPFAKIQMTSFWCLKCVLCSSSWRPCMYILGLILDLQVIIQAFRRLERKTG